MSKVTLAEKPMKIMSSKKVYYPSLNIDRAKEEYSGVGKTGKAVIEYKVVEEREDEQGVHCRLEVRSIDFGDKKGGSSSKRTQSNLEKAGY